MLRFPSFDRNASDSYSNTSVDFRDKIKKDTIFEQFGENDVEYGVNYNEDMVYDEKKELEKAEKEGEYQSPKNTENEYHHGDTLHSPGTPKISEEKTYLCQVKNKDYDEKKDSDSSSLSPENDDDDKTLIKGDESKEHRDSPSYASDTETKNIQVDLDTRMQKEENVTGMKYMINVDMKYLDSPTSIYSPSYPTFDAESSDGGNNTPTNI